MDNIEAIISISRRLPLSGAEGWVRRAIVRPPMAGSRGQTSQSAGSAFPSVVEDVAWNRIGLPSGDETA